jgi:hypothetical protein
MNLEKDTLMRMARQIVKFLDEDATDKDLSDAEKTVALRTAASLYDNVILAKQNAHMATASMKTFLDTIGAK